jgi:hypothetical protein
MPLPKIEYPINEIEVPSMKKKFKFRPMLVKEEKILLMAKTSEDDTDIFNAVRQVVTNCCVDTALDVDKLAIFDLEYLFLKLRAISIGETTDVSFRDNEDEQVYDFTIDLTKINVEFPKDVEKTIKISDTSGFTMKYPPATLYSDKEFLSLEPNMVFDRLVLECIDKVFDGEQIYESSLYKKAEMEEFIESLPVKAYDQVREFFTKVPSMKHEIKYTNSKGSERTVTLRNLSDFFTLR